MKAVLFDGKLVGAVRHDRYERTNAPTNQLSDRWFVGLIVGLLIGSWVGSCVRWFVGSLVRWFVGSLVA